MPQFILRHKNRVILKIWNGTVKSAITSLVRMSTGISASVHSISCEITLHMGGTPQFPRLLMSMMVFQALHGSSYLAR
jgi:hypothetical protein